ncbi:hypothetical protein GCK72_004866 [Caenorhabditis remanei]|uniref:Nonsense-mediated mRNA decay factor SMG8 n=1 Tax=Caenorhabditis remanei TaxID=31234 RepID=A0A6A5HCB1_CAERE|nr:hypothetical protein GCK72_004866 [Caenorhabditis remanei]KAF1764915.1 hypothetical protein GCK72_004866 [Caenorhabditis remanei]
MNISEWLEQSKTVYKAQLDTKIKVIGIIGKDYPDHGKGDNINCYLRENVFPVTTGENETCTISAHFSDDEQILFLVMNGADDVANIRKCLNSENRKTTNYFDAMAESESQEMRMLHFLFISCHFIIIFEQTSRIDLEFMRFLRKVNSLRLQLRKKVNKLLVSSGLRDVSFNNRTMTNSESEGRMVIPRLLVAFQRNNIRPDVNVNKKQELYEKLEKNLDNQLTDILKLYDLIDCGANSLCQLNETIPIVHLLNPNIVKRDIVSEMFEIFMAEAENTKLTGNNHKLASNNSFVKFLEDNFRSERNEITLENVIKVMTTLQCVLDGSLEEKPDATVTQMQSFIKRIQTDHLEEARRLYTNEKRPISGERRGFRMTDMEVTEPVRIRSKEEHQMRFNEATLYIESVVGVNSSQVLSEMQAQCNEMWQSDLRACESISMMGHPCIKKVHPTYGDQTAPESRWTSHDASNTSVGTCICGKKQMVRQEPFSVKEANCDFYENPEFKCCKRLWRYQFQLYQEDAEEKDDIMWADRESNSLRAAKKMAQREDELAEETIDDLDIPESLRESESSSEFTDSDEDEDIRVQSASDSLSDTDSFIRPNSRREELTSSAKTERDLAVEHAKRMQKLEKSGKMDEFLMGVPNSLTAGKLPIFPSFFLTCLGDSSIYKHAGGLKDQPNFKMGGEYLSPAVVFLDVNPDVWARDVNKMRSEDSSRKCGKEQKDDVPRVKLFVGFEYECSRGHRFFVDHRGEPIIYSKGSSIIRESTHRASLGDVLDSDLPLRRPCTCRKLPLKSAQLQKIHVVTPKAPVHISINPKMLVPGHEGVYGTGQEPLELHHSKYYILHLPVIYSGPSGTWMPEEYSSDKQGTLRKGAIKVVYKPVLSFRW